MAMPSPGAVWPAMVRPLEQETTLLRCDGSPYIEYDETSTVAHRIAERTRAAVRQCRDVINRTPNARTRGTRTKAQRAGEGGNVGLERRDNQIHQAGRVRVNRANGIRRHRDGQTAQGQRAAVSEQRVGGTGESAAGGDVQSAAQIEIAADDGAVAARAKCVIQNRAAVGGEIIADGECADGIARRENSAAVDRDRSADGAAAAQGARRWQPSPRRCRFRCRRNCSRATCPC